MSEWDAISTPAEADWDEVSAVAPSASRGKRDKKKRSLMDDVTGAMANVNRGLGIGDEMTAGFATVGDVITGKVDPLKAAGAELALVGGNIGAARRLSEEAGLTASFKRNMAAQRGVEDEFATARPRAAALARGAGNALTMAAPIGPGAQAFATGNRAVNALRGATVAGLSGAGYAAVDRGTAQERLGAASRASYDPATLALGGAAGGLAGRPRATPRGQPAPPLEDLQARRTTAYDDVAASGHSFQPDQIQGLARSIADDLGSVQISAARHPRAASMLEDITGLGASGEPMTLTQLDQLRQVVRRDVANSTDPAEAFMGKRIIAQIDTFIDEAGGEGADMIREARDLNTRVRKIETLDDLDVAAGDRAAATGVGANVDNAARQNVIRFKNKAKNLTPAERAAADRVIRGTPTQNALRAVGRLSPEGGTGAAVGSIFTGAASGGAIPAAGFVARRVADAMTTRNVNELRNLIAEGGIPVADEIESALIAAGGDDLLQQLANDLSAAAGVQGASRRGAVEAYVPSRPDYGVGVAR